MTAGAAASQRPERSLRAGASSADLALRAAYALCALAVIAAAAVAPPDSAAAYIGRFVGQRMLHDRAFPLALGSETFTAPGAYDGAIGWLGALTTAALSSRGPVAATFATIVAALAAFGFVELRARRVAGRPLALVAVALTGVCAIGSFGFAGGIVTAAFASALAFVLDRPGPRAAVLATLVAIVWCNVAPQGLLAPVIALCMAVSVAGGHAPAGERRWAWYAFAGTCLAIVCTPALFAYPALAFEGLRVDRGLDGLVPIAPIDVAPLAYRAGFTLLVVAAFALGAQRGREGAIPLLLFGALLALANGAYVVVFAVLAAPMLADSAALAFPALARGTHRVARGDLAIVPFVLAVAAFAAWDSSQRPAAAAGGYALAASLAADGRTHRVFCSNLDWCDAALSGAPAVRVFMDGRVAAYPAGVTDAKRAIAGMKAHWRKRLDDAGVNAIVAAKDHAFAGLLGLSPGWHVAASNDDAVLYERPGTGG